MSYSQKALRSFLIQNSKIRPLPGHDDTGRNQYYVFNTEDSLFYMTVLHFQQMRIAIGQTHDASFSENAGQVMMIHDPDAAEQRVEAIAIPVALPESLGERQSLILLRNLQGIKQDIDEGKSRKTGLELLFDDTADIAIATNADGERIYLITGKQSESDQRNYAERYAEQIATNVLFDVGKALNSRLKNILPPELQGKYFIEGRDMSDRKIRYGTDIHTELALSDEGAALFMELGRRDPLMNESLAKVFQQAILDPFGLSLKHYMGKHHVSTMGKKALVKMPSWSGMFLWLRGCFSKKKAG